MTVAAPATTDDKSCFRQPREPLAAATTMDRRQRHHACVQKTMTVVEFEAMAEECQEW
ncbi:hypothetical protein HanRHA438_Chr07g0297201 [Helianthus annuus]|nr:hypothetical protein HanRHA438_Chr07g0297201 [Helianthus annuus]